MTAVRVAKCSCGAEYRMPGESVEVEAEVVAYRKWLEGHLTTDHTLLVEIGGIAGVLIAECECGDEYRMPVDGTLDIPGFVEWVEPHVAASHTPRVIRPEEAPL